MANIQEAACSQSVTPLREDAIDEMGLSYVFLNHYKFFQGVAND